MNIPLRSPQYSGQHSLTRLVYVHCNDGPAMLPQPDYSCFANGAYTSVLTLGNVLILPLATEIGFVYFRLTSQHLFSVSQALRMRCSVNHAVFWVIPTSFANWILESPFRAVVIR